jgi:membrane-bound metal-dependent hydrolase YbcI (DUF457 family)
MFVGHAALAFGVAVLGARSLGWGPDRALGLGIVVAVAATLPDLDMLSVLPGLLAGPIPSHSPVEAFWTGASAHRSLTHSLIVALPVGAVVGLVSAGGRVRIAGLALAAGTGIGLLALPGGTAVVIVPFVLGAVAVGMLATRLPVSWTVSGVGATAALLTHPLGDLVTGDPPWLLYPAGVEVLTGRVTLAADPTLHLLAAFFLELGAIWLGVTALLHLRERSLRAAIHPRAALGGLFAGAAFLIPAPTLSVSYQFVFGVLAVGAVGIDPRRRLDPLEVVPTGLAAITLAGVSYATAYLLVLP